MKLLTLNRSQLHAFIHSQEFQEMPVLPISYHRGLSHVQNPRADEEDVLLLLMYDDADVLVGYLGVLPDWLYLDEGKEKVGWLSCLWVDPRTRGQGIAKKLVSKALECWQQRIMITEFTPAARRLYEKLEAFNDLSPKEGLRCYLRLNLAYVLPPKKAVFAKLRPLLRLSDGLFNGMNDLRLSFLRSKPSKAVRYMSIPKLDADALAFVEARNERLTTRRLQAEFDWILAHPWLLNSPFDDHNSTRYYFSSNSSPFFFHLVKFQEAESGRMIGFLMLAIREKHLKVPYAFFENAYTEEIAHYISQYMLDFGLDMLSLFHPRLVAYFREHGSPFLHKRTIRREFLLSRVFGARELVLMDGDGDAVFT